MVGTHDVGAVPVRAAKPAALWRRSPDAYEAEARQLAPTLTGGGSRASTTSSGRSSARPDAPHTPKQSVAGSARRPSFTARPAPRPDPRLGAGRPLSRAEIGTYEPQLVVDLSGVRVHDGLAAKQAAAAHKAQAFTFGNHVVLGHGPQISGAGQRATVLSHELVHVRQQSVRSGLSGSGSARGPPARGALNTSCAPLGVQCLDVLGAIGDAAGAVADVGSDAVDFAVETAEDAYDWVLDQVTSAARNLPGYDLVADVIGKDPISGDRVNTEPSGLIESLLSYGPFGSAVSVVLDAADIIAEIYTTITMGLERNGLTLARIARDVGAAFDEFRLTKGFDYNYAILEGYLTSFLRDVATFVGEIADRVIELVRSVVVTLAEPLLESESIKPIWTLTKQVLGYDPLLGVDVNDPTVEILANFLRLIGQEEALAQMQERGTLQETADWLDTQFATFTELSGELSQLFSDTWAAIQPGNLATLLDDLPALAQRAEGLMQRVRDFAQTVVEAVLDFVKKSLLAWLSRVAHATPGFHLITLIIGKDPFTGEAVPLTAENLIKAFITLLPGGEETYAQMAESGVIAEAAARIESAMETLGITAELVATTFLGVWNEMRLENLLSPLETFARIVNLFGEPIARIFAFIRIVVGVIIELILRAMNFPTELVGSIITNMLAAIEDIKRDPIGFLVNMVHALKDGFIGFFDHIATYLVDGLAAWLFRGLSEIGVTIPSQWSLQAAFDLVLEVLGLSMEFVWRKLGEQIGEERVAQIREAIGMLSGAWTFIKDVQERGVGAIWDYIVTQLSGLWDTVLSMAREWVMERIISVVTARLLSMLDPTGVMAIINGVVAFFDLVQSAVEYIREILEIVNMYVSTLAAVAAGNTEPGARMIEGGLAAAVPIAIGFLANQVGLSNMPEKIVEIITSLRVMVEQAVDWLIAQALRLGQAALNALGLGDSEEGEALDVEAGAILEFDESFDVDGETHRLYADPASGVLWVASEVPEQVSEIDRVRSFRDKIAGAATKTAKRLEIRKLKAALKANPSWWLHLGESPETGHAPNIGDVGRHGGQGTRWRPRNVKGGTMPRYLPFWELESEHLIPRAQVDQYFRGLHLASTTSGDYRDMTTIMIYKGAARRKTNGEGGDNRILSQIKDRVDAVLDGGTGAPRTYEELLPTVTPLFGAYIHEAQTRAADAVGDEDRSHDLVSTLTNGQIRGQPQAPTSAEIGKAYWDQAMMIDEFLKGRRGRVSPNA